MPMQPYKRFADWLRYRHTLYRIRSLDDWILADLGLSRDTLAERLKQAERQKQQNAC